MRTLALTVALLLLTVGCGEEEPESDCVGQECSELACATRGEETCNEARSCMAYYGRHGCEEEYVFVACGVRRGCQRLSTSGVSPEGECYRFADYCIPWGWERAETPQNPLLCCPPE